MRFSIAGRIARVGLAFSALVAGCQVVTYAWGISIIDEAVAVGDTDRLDSFDNLDAALAITSFLLIVATGIAWLIWQHQLAQAAGSAVRRSPALHVGSWFIPVVGLWWNYQNLADLWRRRFADAGVGVIGLWWALFVGGNALDWISLGMVDSIDSPGTFKGTAAVSLAAAVATFGCALLARRINSRLTAAELGAQQSAQVGDA